MNCMYELQAAILDDRKSLFDHISRQFKSIRNFDFFFKSQNGCRRPFWMTKNRFRSHFSPFQINTQFMFLISKWPPAAILEVRFGPFLITENHFRSHFLSFQINFFCLKFVSKWPPKTIGFFHYVSSMAMPNMKLIGEFLTQLEMPQAF